MSSTLEQFQSNSKHYFSIFSVSILYSAKTEIGSDQGGRSFTCFGGNHNMSGVLGFMSTMG